MNVEGLIDVESTKVLLKESIELFKQQLEQDKAFIQAYNRKVDMRRMIQNGDNIMGVPGFMQNPHEGYGAFDIDGYQEQDNTHNEILKQEEERKKAQIERERR